MTNTPVVVQADAAPFSQQTLGQPVIKENGGIVSLYGEWRLLAFEDHLDDIEGQLDAIDSLLDKNGGTEIQWDLTHVTKLDSTGALVLWRHWGEQLPQTIVLTDVQQVYFAQLADSQTIAQTKREKRYQSRSRKQVVRQQRIKTMVDNGLSHLHGMIALLGQLVLDTLYLCTHPLRVPWREISSTIYQTGVKALFIVGLVGFLIGVVISYLTAIQLQAFGADAFIVKLVGIAVLRELGPMIAAILVAGRSGSAMTAELGVMRVTEELDALRALGVSVTLRLILPKVIALAIAMPLLVLWADIMGMLGGMVAASSMLNFNVEQFLQALPTAVPVANLWLGLLKGVVFGLVIAMTSSHFGMRIKPNSSSLARETTMAVVVAITLVLLVDAIFALLFLHVGLM